APMRMAFLFLILTPFVVQAETAYITDNLRLGLHEAPDTSDRDMQMLESGQELEILSRDRNYANVRLPNGVEGYVEATYL
ncbi:MAG: SH3 domain-containing protein, partial [Woeseiales bacterium]